MKTRAYYGWLATAIVLVTFAAAILVSLSNRNREIGSATTGLPVRAAAPPTQDDFLDHPVSPSLIPPPANPALKSTAASPFLQFNSFVDRMKNLQAVAQRPIVYPSDFTEFIQDEDSKSDWNKSDVLFLTERNGSPTGNTTREYLTSSLDALTLKWKYDSALDAITTDFKWHRDDPRTNGQLLDVLLHVQPAATKPLHLQLIDLYFRATGSPTQTGWLDPHWKYYFVHHELDPDDTWRIAFDALLSKPENFPQVWKLRFIDDVRRYFMASFVENLLTKPVLDDAGREHILVVNNEPEVVSPGEGSACYYVFDLNGRFEQGGIYVTGHRCEDTSAWVDPSGRQLTLRVFFNGSSKFDQQFILTKSGLVLQGITDNEGLRVPATQYSGYRFDKFLYHVPN